MLRSFRAQAFAVGGLLLLLLVSGSFVAQLLITERHQRALAEAVASGALIA